jgi:hypothetical protein
VENWIRRAVKNNLRVFPGCVQPLSVSSR